MNGVALFCFLTLNIFHSFFQCFCFRLRASICLLGCRTTSQRITKKYRTKYETSLHGEKLPAVNLCRKKKTVSIRFVSVCCNKHQEFLPKLYENQINCQLGFGFSFAIPFLFPLPFPFLGCKRISYKSYFCLSLPFITLITTYGCIVNIFALPGISDEESINSFFGMFLTTYFSRKNALAVAGSLLNYSENVW